MLTETITALGPNDPDDGDEGRQRRGIAIAALTKIERNRIGFKVPSQSGNGAYVVTLDDAPFCTCPDFEKHQRACKHVYAVQYTIQRETQADGSTKVTESVTVTKISAWTVYNEAQTHEAERFTELLQALCEGIPTPQPHTGRPRLQLSDVVYSLTSRAYSTMSGRRHVPALREAEASGIIAKAPSYNSAYRYLEDPELTLLLKSLIEESAKPLRAVETDFAVDSTGFSTSTYARWFDHKWGKQRSRQTWVKTHIMCGVKTHVVTAIEATPFESADVKQLPALLERTAQTFPINEVSADKAYSDHRNIHAIDEAGGTAFIPFRSNSTGQASSKHKFDSLWNRMWHFYNFNRESFLEHYHKRSNVESAFSMIKAKFGGAVRAKTPVAQVNEVLCKVLAHNLCCLIQSIYELRLEPVFWAFEAKESVAPKQFSFKGF
jgi:transposase